MNVLLIYPELPTSFWSFQHALRLAGKRSTQPPLGLLTVAAMLPAAWDKRLVDCNVQPLRDADLAWADLALISAMVVQRETARAAIDACHDAGVRVIAGGPLFTMEPEGFPTVDHLILNEAEVTLPAFLADLEHGAAKRVYETADFPPLDASPVPLWSLLTFEHYTAMAVQFSRGCPWRCDFCNVTTLFGRKPRIKAAAQIIRELDALYNAGWRGPVFFVDDNLIGDRRFVKQTLLPALIDWRQDKDGLPFSTEVSINVADDPTLIDLLVRAGFTKVFIGLETPDHDALTHCNKGQNTRADLSTAVTRLQRAGIAVQGGFIVGFDTDTAAIFQRQFDFIQQSGIVIAMANMLQAPPGTALYARMLAEERIVSQPSGASQSGTNVRPLMGLDTLIAGYNRLVTELYSPAPFYERVRRFLSDYAAAAPEVQSKRFGNASGAQRALLAFKVIAQLGLVDRGRLRFWRLLFWVARNRPSLISEALALSLFGWDLRRQQETA